MKSAVGVMKPSFVVKLKTTDEDRQVEFNWLSLVVNQTGIVVLKKQHYPARRSARFNA
jgi:hypothetical protein